MFSYSRVMYGLLHTQQKAQLNRSCCECPTRVESVHVYRSAKLAYGTDSGEPPLTFAALTMFSLYANFDHSLGEL